MIVLLFGGNGQVGYEIVRAGLELDAHIIAPGRSELDIIHQHSVQTLIQESCADVVINAAAYTAVDLAESHQEEAFSVNRDGVATIANACALAQLPLVQVSTDYVFDGQQQSPYREDDATNPLNVYGQSKLDGEEALRDILEQHIILRTSWVFGMHGNNFVKTILRLAQQREELNIVGDQYGCPTPARSIALTLLDICRQIHDKDTVAWGTYHYCGAPVTSWYEFAQQIVSLAKASMPLKLQQLNSIATSDYPTAAVRPGNSEMDCGKIRAAFGIERPDWRSELGTVMSDLSNL